MDASVMPGSQDKLRAPPTGQDLVAQIEAVARERDRAAFEALFRHFAPRLKGYFLRLGTANASEADELVQETMLLVWRKAMLFDPQKAGAATWIFTIARNARIDLRRRSRSATPCAVAGPELMAWSQAPVSGPDDDVSSIQREAGLRQALHTLPPEQMQALELAYFGGRSHSEIANGLNLPLGTVKARLRLALTRLRSALKCQGLHDE